MNLSKSFQADNIKVRVNKRISIFHDIASTLKESSVPFDIYYPSTEAPPNQLNISFGSETDFKDLYTLVSILKDLDIQLIYFSHEIDNLVTIGTYATESRSDEKFGFHYSFDFKTEGISPATLLSQPSTINIKALLRDKYNVMADDMDTTLQKWISEEYNIENPLLSNDEDIERVTYISCTGKNIKSLNGLDKFKNIERINLSDNKIKDFDLSPFPNLKELDCSLNPARSINIKNNHSLEKLVCWGNRGNLMSEIDLSNNSNLKKIESGQDGINHIDLSKNQHIEELTINLSSNIRHVNVSRCSKLRYIKLWGVSVPYIDLTQNTNLEYVEINYWNHFQGKSDVYGPGYPRPIIFVNENFNSNIINQNNRNYEYYTYLLVPSLKDSKEERVLNKLNNLTEEIIEVEDIGKFHFNIRRLLNNEVDTLDTNV